MSIDEANSWLMGSGVPSCTFPNIEDKHEGQIMDIEMGQQRDLQSGKPKCWDDGSPMMQMIITLQTAERNPEVENDNGIRKLYVASKGMREALAAAVKKTGAAGLGVGGRLGMKYVRDGAPTQRGFNPPKEYAARYEPPTVAVSEDGYDDAPPPAAPAEAPSGDVASTPDLGDYSEEPF